MAARKPLRVVSAGEETDSAPERLSVAQAASSGDHRALLVAMRARIAETVSDPKCPPRDLASLTRRLQDIAREIESIELRLREEGADSADVADDEEWTSEAL